MCQAQMAAAEAFAAKSFGVVRKPSALLSSIIRRFEAGGDLNLGRDNMGGSPAGNNGGR